MKNLYLLFFALFITGLSFGQNAFISEIKYTGTEPGIELTGVGEVDLSGWRLNFYGTNGKVYLNIDLSQRLNNSTLWISVNNISQGHPKGAGIALIKGDGSLVEFLFYENPWFSIKGMPSEKTLFVGEASGEDSLQKNGKGEWVSGPSDRAGKTLSIVKNQIEGFSMYPNPVSNGNVYLTSDSHEEKQVEIYALSGQLVYNNIVKSNESMNVSNLNRGIYMVRILEEGNIATRKLVVN